MLLDALIDLATRTIEQQRANLEDKTTRLEQLSLENERMTQDLADQIVGLKIQLADSEAKYGQAIDGASEALDLVGEYERDLETYRQRNEELERKMVRLEGERTSDQLEALRKLVEEQRGLKGELTERSAELHRRQITLNENQAALETLGSRAKAAAAAAQQELDSNEPTLLQNWPTLKNRKRR